MKFIKKLLYRNLSINAYLRTLSRLYFISFDWGILRFQKAFDYPYFLPKLVARGDTVIDIGANLGYYSVLFARILRGQGHLYAVEPVTEIRGVLEHNLRRFKNVTIYPFALGAEQGEVRMGNDSLADNDYLRTGVNMVLDKNTGSDHAAMEFPTQMKRGSVLFGQLEQIDFIKCDIEGYEVVVLTEMAPLIEAHRPTILMETGGDNRVKMIALLGAMGYKPYVLVGKRLQPLSEKDTEDILFIHPQKAERFNVT